MGGVGAGRWQQEKAHGGRKNRHRECEDGTIKISWAAALINSVEAHSVGTG